MALNNKGKILFWEAKFEEAEECFKEAIKRAPHVINVKINYLELLFFRNQIEEAKSLCDEILKTSPNSITARFVLALINLSEDKIDAARELLRELHKLGEYSHLLNYFMALSYVEENNYIEAERYSENSIDEKFLFGFCFLLYGKILFHNEKYDQSRDSLFRFISDADNLKVSGIFKESYAEALFYLGHVYLKLNRDKIAKKWMKRAVKVIKDKQYLNDLAVSYVRIRKFWRANSTIKKALEIDSIYIPSITNQNQLDPILKKLKRKYMIMSLFLIIGIVAFLLGPPYWNVSIGLVVLLSPLIFSKKPKFIFEIKIENFRFEFSEEYDFELDEKALALVLSIEEEKKRTSPTPI